MSAKQPRRNGHACHPIMRKGGVHQQSKSSQRQAERINTQKLARQWRDRAGPDLQALLLPCA